MEREKRTQSYRSFFLYGRYTDKTKKKKPKIDCYLLKNPKIAPVNDIAYYLSFRISVLDFSFLYFFFSASGRPHAQISNRQYSKLLWLLSRAHSYGLETPIFHIMAHQPSSIPFFCMLNKNYNHSVVHSNVKQNEMVKHFDCVCKINGLCGATYARDFFCKK